METTTKTKIKNSAIEIVYLLYMLLFIYAGVSKLLDYSKFKIQLGQSPILSPFATWISILVPLAEFTIVIFLLLRRTRFWGLLACFQIMSLFSFYIYIILHYSSFIPCSCGGILEKMTWGQHLVFNLVFVVMAALAFVFLPEFSNKKIGKIEIRHETKFRIGLLVFLSLSAGVLMFGLFKFSDDVIHYKNKFIRRFPQHTAQEIYQIDLKFNSYYFAGYGDGKLYLGNYTAPLKVLVLDTISRIKKNYQITLAQKDLPFLGPKIRVLNENFFVFEGTVPYLFKGSIENWNANLRLHSGYFFSHVQPMDSANLAVRYLVPKTGQSALGNVNLKDTTKAKFDTSLLEKQFDGIFDTDGTFLYNVQLKRMVYVYYYRNGYLIVKSDLKLDFRGHTIDTVSKAHIELIKYKNSKMKTFAKPPLTVNRTAATYGKLLYVNSTLPGLYESEKLWKIASIIDVYNLEDHTYRSSFPVYDIGGKKLKSMIVYGNSLFVLIDTKLVCYKLRPRLNQERAIRQKANKN